MSDIKRSIVTRKYTHTGSGKKFVCSSKRTVLRSKSEKVKFIKKLIKFLEAQGGTCLCWSVIDLINNWEPLTCYIIENIELHDFMNRLGLTYEKVVELTPEIASDKCGAFWFNGKLESFDNYIGERLLRITFLKELLKKQYNVVC